MVKLCIDGRPVEAPEGTTVLQAAASAGIRIPHFCHHPAFPPEGSCRICLVAVEGLPKLELACSTVVREGMRVTTECDDVRAARRAVLEFLLADHPLDCPICDKAGDCKLQDYSREHGVTENAFSETKEQRSKLVRLGDKLLLDRERCILCSRCVRFLIHVTGTRELGVFRRGIKAEVDLYEGEPVRNNYSGNLVDVCPVGAITDRDFRFRTRPWFLQEMPTLCPLCSRGCNLWADYHPGFPRVADSAGIFRFRPRPNEAVNGHWICDIGRHGAMALVRDRVPEIQWINRGPSGSPNWEKALAFGAAGIRELRQSGRIGQAALLLSTRLTAEELFLARKIFLDGLGISRIAFADPAEGPADAILLRRERTPNVRGARMLGFDTKAELSAAVSGASILWIFGADPAGLVSLRDAPGPLEKAAGTKVLITAHPTGLEPLVDLVLPAASVFEKGGTYVNADGLVQAFEPVHQSCGEARPEWRILLDLGAALGLPGEIFKGPADLVSVSRALRTEHPEFRGEVG